jgi:hypothetical protein
MKRLCVVYDHEHYGYGDSWGYMMGQSRFNTSLFGWAGHTNTSGVLASVAEVLDMVRSHTPSDVMLWIAFETVTEEWIYLPIELIYLKSINYPHNCYTLDLTDNSDVREKGIKILMFQFHDMKNNSVEIKVEGSTLTSNIFITENAYFSTGDAIKMNVKGVLYGVQVEKNVFVEEDPTKSCRTYPIPDYRSYSDCVDSRVKDALSLYFPGLVPVWMAGNGEKVTTKHVVSEKGLSICCSTLTTLTSTTLTLATSTIFSPQMERKLRDIFITCYMRLTALRPVPPTALRNTSLLRIITTTI